LVAVAVIEIPTGRELLAVRAIELDETGFEPLIQIELDVSSHITISPLFGE
jgi:hypothetical protein